MSKAAVVEPTQRSSKFVGANGKFAKGNPGKPKGALDRSTRDIRVMVQQALHGAGGVDYLIARALDPRTASAFLTLVGKTMPLMVNGAGPNGELEVVRRIEVVVVDPRCQQPALSSSPLPALSSR